MKTRFLRIVWMISACWLALIIYGGTLGTAKEDFFLNLAVFGSPAFIGLLLCYLLTGSFLWPKNIADESPISKPESVDLTVPVFKEPSSVEDDFLANIERSKRLIATELESSRKALEVEWKNRHQDELQKVEKLEEVIKKSNVIESSLYIAKETYHWRSWINNQHGQWQFPDWITNRVLPTNTEDGESITLESFATIIGKSIKQEFTLKTAFAFKDGKDEIAQYLYSTSTSHGGNYGRLLIKLNQELVLDAFVTQDIGDQYDNWHFSYGGINFGKIGNWMSSIVNLEEEFLGQNRLDKTTKELKAQENKINNFS
jgi:hypothetical protein